MKVLVAGATGAIGRPLLPLLIKAGYRVAGITRSAEKATLLSGAGIEPVVCDVLDRAKLVETLAKVRPEAVIHQLTELPQDLDLKKLEEFYRKNNRIRSEGTKNLLDAARLAGVRRFLVQSMASWYRPGKNGLRTEHDQLYLNAPEPVGKGVRALKYMETIVLESELEGIVLRYGAFYGPGTWFSRNGSAAKQVLARKYPIIGNGSGVYSWIHIDDAAEATVAALDRAQPGVYNVADDEPAAVREWLPIYAATLGAKPPRKVPLLVARFLGGGIVKWESTMPGASNARIKKMLEWKPRYETWRRGFAEAL
jgi:nucleoside-diphosphate-sugar epimerase